MELATRSLPSRPTAAASTAERHGDAWGDFLRRVLVPAGPAKDDRIAGLEAQPDRPSLRRPGSSRPADSLTAAE